MPRDDVRVVVVGRRRANDDPDPGPDPDAAAATRTPRGFVPQADLTAESFRGLVRGYRRVKARRLLSSAPGGWVRYTVQAVDPETREPRGDVQYRYGGWLSAVHPDRLVLWAPRSDRSWPVYFRPDRRVRLWFRPPRDDSPAASSPRPGSVDAELAAFREFMRQLESGEVDVVRRGARS